MNESSTGDALHDQIRALRLPAYPLARIYTDVMSAFSTATRIIVYMDDRQLFTIVLADDRVGLKGMVEDGSLVTLLTERTTHFFRKRLEDDMRHLAG